MKSRPPLMMKELALVLDFRFVISRLHAKFPTVHYRLIFDGRLCSLMYIMIPCGKWWIKISQPLYRSSTSEETSWCTRKNEIKTGKSIEIKFYSPNGTNFVDSNFILISIQLLWQFQVSNFEPVKISWIQIGMLRGSWTMMHEKFHPL